MKILKIHRETEEQKKIRLKLKKQEMETLERKEQLLIT